MLKKHYFMSYEVFEGDTLKKYSWSIFSTPFWSKPQGEIFNIIHELTEKYYKGCAINIKVLNRL